MIEFVRVENGQFEVNDVAKALLVAEQCAGIVRLERGRIAVTVDADQLGECAKRLAARGYKFTVI